MLRTPGGSAAAGRKIEGQYWNFRGHSRGRERLAGALSRQGKPRQGSSIGDRVTRMHKIATALLIAAALSAVGISSMPCRADQPPVMDELVVTGERPGPGMWHVHRGAAQVWILGSMSPLPKGITWRSAQVEQVLGSANRVLVQKPFDIGIARILWLLITERSALMVRGGKRLKDVLPADLHARFALQRAKYTERSE